jgi:hypothetical protein
MVQFLLRSAKRVRCVSSAVRFFVAKKLQALSMCSFPSDNPNQLAFYHKSRRTNSLKLRDLMKNISLLPRVVLSSVKSGELADIYKNLISVACILLTFPRTHKMLLSFSLHSLSTDQHIPLVPEYLNA